ncbi:hypothetical protein, partial [Azospirillum sp. B506]|uniref:hypothetical protein n=1 Tax=Azospirillum sp. B506 TaxID=137721 RepID=UPI0005B2A2CB
MADPRPVKAGASPASKTAKKTVRRRPRDRRRPAAAPSPHRSARSRWAASLPGALALGLACWLLL